MPTEYDFTRYSLPDPSNWRFERIASENAERASCLETAGSPSALVATLVGAMAEGVSSGAARFGTEVVEDCRAVIQFQVAPQVFDWFFNGRTGYRAHFRAHPDCGSKFNSQLLEAVRVRLISIVSVSVPARRLDSDFQDRGETILTKSFMLSSLVPNLAKIWFCTRLMGFDGVVRDLPLGITGPKLLMDGGAEWIAPFRDPSDTWLEIKGAFLGREGPFQLKNPTDRAHRLHKTGTT